MKEKIITFTFLIYLFLFASLHILLVDKTISETERRKLNTLPKLELTSEYITKLDSYLLDHFPYRDGFRRIKAGYNYNILNKLDNNGIFMEDNRIYKSNYPTNYKSINNFKNNIYKIIENFTSENNTYIALVPDKNYYLDNKNFLQIDYDYIYNEVGKLNLKQIDLRNILEENDYYETDTHWKQENLDKVVKEITKNMDLNYQHVNYYQNTYDRFYGVYYGESATKREPETITYLSNSVIDNAKVTYLENKTLHTVYNKEKLYSLDSYEVYLDGASAFIEITNEKANSDKELIIFRDSFGSSIAPLLINYYSKITLIDTRYINSDNFLKLIEFNNQDILFIYSTLIVNNSFSLKN